MEETLNPAAPAAAESVPAPGPVTVVPYRHEDPLFWISTYVACSIWLVLLVLTVGLIIPIMLFLGLLGLFTRSLLVSWVRGNALKVSAEQFPDLHVLFEQSCQRLGVQRAPELYLCQADGMLNALAVRFMRRDYVVLLSSVVDALKDRPEAIKFYMGHELAHIQRKHLTRHWWLAPAGLTPLLAPAYSRACEYTCDRHGLACCNNLEDAQRALVVLAAGSERWKAVNLAAFEAQAQDTGRFWMAVNELTADYPWLCKRLVRLKDRDASFPRRSAWAWLIAALSPRLGYGGAVVGFLYLLIMGGVILAMVLALAFSGSGLAEKLEGFGRQVVGELGLPVPHDEASAESESDREASASTEVNATPASAADMHRAGQMVAEAIDAHAQAAKGKFPEGLGELDGLADRLTATMDNRWEVIEFDYTMPADSKSRLAELALSASCAECGDQPLGLRYQRTTAGAWKCTVTAAVDGVSVEGCAAAR